MLFSDARNRKVVSSSDAATIGKISRFVVDPDRRAVVALELKKTDDGDVLRWSDITAFGTDAVTVTDATKIGTGGDDIATFADKHHRVLGKQVLSTVGDRLGEVDDVAFEPESGLLTALALDNGTEVAASRLLGIGSYAVVVAADEA